VILFNVGFVGREERRRGKINTETDDKEQEGSRNCPTTAKTSHHSDLILCTEVRSCWKPDAGVSVLP
jgi:hypothetical protein